MGPLPVSLRPAWDSLPTSLTGEMTLKGSQRRRAQRDRGRNKVGLAFSKTFKRWWTSDVYFVLGPQRVLPLLLLFNHLFIHYHYLLTLTHLQRFTLLSSLTSVFVFCLFVCFLRYSAHVFCFSN